MNATNVKTRHYAALSSRLRTLRSNLAESEHQFELLAEQLQSMSKLGAYHGAQFMAVSRLLDKELDEVQQVEAAAADRQSA